jgi:2-succinyl-6-hydroxy-2,4-cyclohexadiene-1-carboxylate synthase
VPADQLAFSSRGTGDRVVLVHGFTQTERSWDRVAARLAQRHTVVTIDAPGHGESSGVRADVPAAAALLGAVGGPATYVGYSMGGRLCLQLAVDQPDLVRRLVLVSATAGIDDAAEREARRQADEQLAASVERNGVDAFLDRWLALPLFATLPRDAAALDDRRRNTAEGLASSLRLVGAGTQEPLWDRLPELSMPVLLLVGALDTKYVALAERMAQLIRAAELQVVESTGHAVHLEAPDAFADALDGWLRP